MCGRDVIGGLLVVLGRVQKFALDLGSYRERAAEAQGVAQTGSGKTLAYLLPLLRCVVLVERC